MGIFDNFTLWKSASDQRREQEEYSKWAFPYGEKQRENVNKLLAEVFSKKDSFIMFTFLTLKEMVEKAIEDNGSENEAIKAILTGKQKTRLQLIKQLKKDEWYKYLAIVLADRKIDIECEYPTAEEILEKAKQIGEQVRD